MIRIRKIKRVKEVKKDKNRSIEIKEFLEIEELSPLESGVLHAGAAKKKVNVKKNDGGIDEDGNVYI